MELINHLLLNLAEPSICSNDFSRQNGLGIGNELVGCNSLHLYLCVVMAVCLEGVKGVCECCRGCSVKEVAIAARNRSSLSDGGRDPPA